MPSTLYLIRNNNLTWVKYTSVSGVYLTGNQTTYTGVTGNQATDVITIPGSAIVNGMTIIFSSKTGGTGLNTNTAYYAVSASGTTCKLAATVGGAAINFTTSITAGTAIVAIDNMQVWSAEFRDVFQSSGSVNCASNPAIQASGSMPGTGKITGDATFFIGPGTNNVSVSSDITNLSDEAKHEPLRQTFLNASFWKFDMGSNQTPQFLYASYQDGDIISNQPPQTA